MSEEFGKRKSMTHVSDKEREDLKNAFVALNAKEKLRFAGSRGDKPFPGGVSYWFKQDEIHQATHVHGGPAFLTWHRELCNRLEALLRLVDKKVSLHYWDWNEDPNDLFTSKFMGSPKGEAGEPWLSAGFYNPYSKNENYRGAEPFDTDHSNPADQPITLTREKEDGTLQEYMIREKRTFYTDKDIIESENYGKMRLKIEHVHNWAHNYIGGTIGDPHTSFRDPFVFLIHSNVDRLFAAWQLRKGKGEEFVNRLDPEQVYGCEKDTVARGSTSPYIIVGIRTMLSPWCGIGYPYDGEKKKHMNGEKEEPGVTDVRPWTYPENWQRDPNRPHEKPKNSLDPSIVRPRAYDKFPAGFDYNYNLVRTI